MSVTKLQDIPLGTAVNNDTVRTVPISGVRDAPMGVFSLYTLFTEIIKLGYMTGDMLPYGDSKVWTDDVKTTGINITPEHSWSDGPGKDFRPVILVAIPEGVTYKALKTTAGAHTAYDPETAEYTMIRLVSGTIAYQHIGRRAFETSAIIDQTVDFLTAFCEPIRKQLCFKTLELAGFNANGVVKDEETERKAGVVSVKFELEETATIKLESHKLKKISGFLVDLPG